MLIKKLAVTNWVEKLDSGFSLAVITASWEISSSSSSEIEFMNSSNVLSFIGFTSLHYSALAGACNRSISHNKLKGDQAMLKKIKKKLKEPYFMEDLWCYYIRPAVMGLIGAAIGIATVIVIRLL